jgi:hypothetical protein
MKEIEKQYRKNGYIFDQIWRKGDVCIYSQTDPDSGRVVAYEVFEVIKREEAEIQGNVIPAKESCPGNEQWGSKGYTCWTIPEAMGKAALVGEAIYNRNLVKRAS